MKAKQMVEEPKKQSSNKDKEFVEKFVDLAAQELPEFKDQKEKSLNDGEVIWNEIKNVPMSMFGLPSRTVEHYFEKVATGKTMVLLKLKTLATSSVDTLDCAINNLTGSGSLKNQKYTVEVLETGGIHISRFKS